MSFTESAESTLGRKVGPLPIAGWAAIGIGTLVVVKVVGGHNAGGSSAGGNGGFPALPDLPDAGAVEGGGSGTGASGGSGSGTTQPATSPGVGTTPSVPSKYAVTLDPKLGATSLYSTLGKLLGTGHYSGTYTASITKVGGRSYYRFLRSGRWTLVPTSAKTIRVKQL